MVLQWLLRLQGKSFFFLLLLAVAGFHSFPLLACLPSVCACGGVFDVLAVSLLQTALGTSYLTPPQPLWCCAAFSPPLAAQPPTAGCSPPGHTFCRQVCCLSLCQEKGPACSLKSALQLLHSAASSGQRHCPLLGQMVQALQLELQSLHFQTSAHLSALRVRWGEYPSPVEVGTEWSRSLGYMYTNSPT